MSTLCLKRLNIGAHILEVYQNDKGIRWYAFKDDTSEVILSEDELCRLASVYTEYTKEGKE